MSTNRRTFIIAGSVVAVAAVAGGAYYFMNAGQNSGTSTQAAAQPIMAPTGDIADKVEGSADAPVTVIEYASPTCPHCASFHNTTYPQLKTDYIDTGKIKFIVRPFLRNEVDAAIFMLAESAGPERYEEVLSTYFATQNSWMAAPGTEIFRIAQQLGFTQETFDAALTNQELLAGMEAMRTQAMDEFDVTGTPSFFVNGSKVTTGYTIEQLAAVIDPLVPADFVATEAPAEAPAATTPAAPATDTMAPANNATTPVDTMAPASNTMAPADTMAPANTMAPTNEVAPTQ